MRKIIVNSFAQRHTADSRFSHFTGTDEDLLTMVRGNFDMCRPGYREGVVLVPVDASRFFSGVVQLKDGDPLAGAFEPRRNGEDPRKVVSAVGASKMPAKNVEIVLYSSAVLAEGGDNELPAGPSSWEIISINASPETYEVPISPDVLMHNHFGSTGGTATNLNDEDFVEMLRNSFIYWKDKAMCG